MSPIKIAMMNSIFRLATIMILLPCINLIEKLVFRLIKDDPEDLEEQADFDLLEERFLAYPALAIGQSHTAVNGMAKKARKNINRALSLLGDYSQDKYNKVQEKENLIDKYGGQARHISYAADRTGDVYRPDAAGVQIPAHDQRF